MSDVLIPLALALFSDGVATWLWRHHHRVSACVVWMFGLCAVLVAIRTLPGPVVVGLLIGALVVVGVNVAKPWLLRLYAWADSRTEENR